MEASKSLENENHLAQKYLKGSTLVEEAQPPVFALPLEKESATSGSYSKYLLGEENLWVPNKVIIMMGETGAGKTTLINAMANYILGVQWEDPFRFKLVHEMIKKRQAESQTSKVTVYVLNHQQGFQIPYSLTVVDTPGFGDTRGMEHDKLITEQIQALFSSPGGIDHIDSVCFVIQASSTRLTPTQKYVIRSVLSIFGKDIEDNIQMLLTFADGKNPNILEAIQAASLPCAKEANGTPVYYKFNNSALFTNNARECSTSFNFDEMFWKMGSVNMKTFFDSLNQLETKSLILTNEVLRERKKLETVLAGLESQIKAALLKMEEVKKRQQALDQHKEDMAAGRDFVCEVSEVIRVKEETETYATNCNQCNFTCHFPCWYFVGYVTPFCSAINLFTGRCHVCPGNCSWYDHSLQRYRFVDKVVEKKRTLEELKQKSTHGSGEAMTIEQVLQCAREEYDAEEEALMGLIEKASHSFQRLQEIAMNPIPLTSDEYIDRIFQVAEQEVNPECQGGVSLLKQLRGRDKTGGDLQGASGRQDPSEQIQKSGMTDWSQ